MMFDLGLRRGEVLGLDVEDVDRAGQRLWVLGKGGRRRRRAPCPRPRWRRLTAGSPYGARPRTTTSQPSS